MMPSEQEHEHPSVEIRLKAVGPAFVSGGALDATVDLLQGYGVVFAWCLQRAGRGPGGEVARLKITRIEPGSIDVQMATEIGAALAPLWPQLFGQAWNLYKAGYDLIQVAVRYMNQERRPMHIHIENSPGATVNIVGRDHVQVSRDVYETAAKHSKWYAKLAQLVSERKADNVSIEAEAEAEEVEPPPAIVYNRENAHNFDMPRIRQVEEAPVDLACAISRFNKRTNKGAVEYTDDDGNLVARPFTIEPELHERCVKAFGLDSVTVSATRSMDVNALGETRITHFHLVGIHMPGGADEQGADTE